MLLESADLEMILLSYVPQRTIDENGMLFCTSKKGWLIFDYYGAYKQHIDYAGWKDVECSQRQSPAGIITCFIRLTGRL